jgi:hypothetical protein
VTRHGDLAAAARRVSLDRRDHRLRESLDAPEERLPAPDEGVQLVGTAAEGAGQVRAPAEDAVAGAREDDRLDRVVPHELVHGAFELEDELGGDRVGGRAVERDHCVPVSALEDQGLVGHRVVRSSDGGRRAERPGRA